MFDSGTTRTLDAGDTPAVGLLDVDVDAAFDVEFPELDRQPPEDCWPDDPCRQLTPQVWLSWAEAEPAGPQLAVLLGNVDTTGLSTDDQLRLAEQWARVEAHACAGKLAAVAGVAARYAADATLSGSAAAEFVDCEIGAALRLSPMSAGRLVHAAQTLAYRLPGTAAALSSGRIDYLR